MKVLSRVLATFALVFAAAGAFAQAPETILINGKIIAADERGSHRGR